MFKSMNIICPKCGREGGYIDAFCVDCYPYKIECPSKITIIRCKKCEKIKLSGKWEKASESKIRKQILKQCKGEFLDVEYDEFKKKLIFEVKKGKFLEKNFKLEIEDTTCPYCSRISGGYYEAIIQLRGNPKKIEKEAEKIKRTLSKKTFLTKEEEKHGGVDIYVGSSKAVLEYITENKIKAKKTTKLVGMKEGKRLYRLTVSIRLE